MEKSKPRLSVLVFSQRRVGFPKLEMLAVDSPVYKLFELAREIRGLKEVRVLMFPFRP